ncbi:MAG TPA: hypothetical protein VK705_12185 [Ferruginibacter sp.]|jgi:hypothetical protein|nr:hypothetical protein [Ferruginibacter sp.]
MEKELIENIKKDMAIILPDKISLKELEEALTIYANQLIQKDFQKLVTLLYRIDVSEAKLKYLLQLQTDENSGNIIAKLIIERQLQKIKSRQQFSKHNDNISEEEKW